MFGSGCPLGDTGTFKFLRRSLPNHPEGVEFSGNCPLDDLYASRALCLLLAPAIPMLSLLLTYLSIERWKAGLWRREDCSISHGL